MPNIGFCTFDNFHKYSIKAAKPTFSKQNRKSTVSQLDFFTKVEVNLLQAQTLT